MRGTYSSWAPHWGKPWRFERKNLKVAESATWNSLHMQRLSCGMHATLKTLGQNRVNAHIESIVCFRKRKQFQHQLRQQVLWKEIFKHFARPSCIFRSISTALRQQQKYCCRCSFWDLFLRYLIIFNCYEI